MSDQDPAPEVTFSLPVRETTTDYSINGAQPIRSLLGPDALMAPELVRVISRNDGSPALAYVHGPKLSASGKLLKTTHRRPLHPDDDDAPEWFKRLMDYEAMVTAQR